MTGEREKVECYGGPRDGDMVEIPVGHDRVFLRWEGVTHRYVRRNVWDTDLSAKFDHMGEL